MDTLKKLLVALAITSMAGAGVLYAQPAPDEDDDSDVAVPMGTTANLTPAEMQSQSATLIEEMRTVLRRVLQLQQAARKQKDIIKLNCVNDKLLQIKQLLNIAEASRNNLVESIANRDSGGSQHAFSQVTVASEKSSGLRDEAEACIGEEITFIGPSEVEVDAPPIPDDPTDDDPFQVDDIVVEDPGYRTPYY